MHVAWFCGKQQRGEDFLHDGAHGFLGEHTSADRGAH
jgi:hypothetical protein